ncbi:hypothetical protein ACFVT9_29485 [Kitasatospora cineracea]|uniref:hypothetical protein n=1 Tax=Kitasatospora cineracea TaxID=88074 RepID=UPI0036DE5955
MLRLIPTRLWKSTQRRLRHAEDILAAQAAGWQAPLPPVDGDLADVLRYVDAAVRDEAVCRAADYCEQHLDPTHSLGLTVPERWSGHPDGSAVYCLGAGQWLYYHPGRTQLRTHRGKRHPEAEQVCLIASGPRPWEFEPVAGLPALLELLGADCTGYRTTVPAPAGAAASG